MAWDSRGGGRSFELVLGDFSAAEGVSLEYMVFVLPLRWVLFVVFLCRVRVEK